MVSSVPLKRQCQRLLLGVGGLLMAVVQSGFAQTQVLNENFDSLPAGSEVFGNAAVADGILHLTDAVNSQSGAWRSPAIPSRVASYTINFKALVGGGTCCGDPVANPFATTTADGFSVNVATDLPAGTYAIAEEGAGTGLSVNFDTWDNGGAEAPAIEVKWGGVSLRSVRTQVAQSPNMALVSFKDVQIEVTGAGLVSVRYDGTNVMTGVQIPAFVPQAGLAIGMGGRTGGANENHWIDDLRVSVALADLSSVQLIAPAGRSWKYDDTTLSPGLAGTGWETVAYDDTTWKSGPALFGNDGAGIYDTASQPFAGRGTNGFETPLDRTGGRVTFYFRTKFNWSGSTAGVTLVSSNWVDDGIRTFLNGVEVSRIRLPAGDLTWDTLGSNPGTEGVVEVANWDAASLVEGENTVAVELHQSGTASSDVAFALGLNAVAPLSPTIVDPTEPADRVVFANRPTTLSAKVVASPAPTYQWYKDGAPIDGATSADYVIAQMQPSDAGAYFARVSNVVGTVDTRTATVAYVLDETAPKIAAASGSGTFDRVSVLFDEIVEDESATDEFNYTISGGVTVSSATRGADGRSVLLILDAGTPLVEDTEYTVTVINVEDLAGNTLVSETATFRSFVLSCGFGTLEAYPVGGGVAVAQLTSHPSYPNNPDFRGPISEFDIRVATDPANPTFYNTDARENYGGRLRAFFIPSESGPHIFYFASDDNGELWMSADERPSQKVLIARETVWSASKEWTVSGGASSLTQKRSTPINLVAGRAYYMEALYHEGGGGDNAAVAVQQPSQTEPPVNGQGAIPASMLGGAAPAGLFGTLAVTTQPASATLVQNATASFSVAVSSPTIEDFRVPTCYQWTRDGVDIAGATGPSYSFGPVTLADSGAVFAVRASMPGSKTVSADAVLTVEQDVTKPTVASVKAAPALNRLVVTFSELVQEESAGDEFAYSIVGQPAITVTTAALGADGKTVSLILSGDLTADTAYELSVSGVRDLAGNEMDAATIPFRTFARIPGFAVAELYLGITGGVIADLTGNPKYPGLPDLTRYRGLFELNTFDEFENYGARMSGWLTAPVSGRYTFYMSSDDQGAFFLSTDQSPANLVMVAQEPVWNGRRDWTGTVRRDPVNPENRSTRLFPDGIEMTAGQSYYFEALMKEGGGGDNLAVTWRIPGAPEPINGSTPISGVYLSSLADPSGAQLAITQQPVDQTFVLGGPETSVTFAVAINASKVGETTPTTFYQWMRDSGAGFVPVPGANGPTLTINPIPSDNGARFRAEIYIIGAHVTSDTAVLNVVSPNTPPRFTGHTVPAVQEDSGPQSIPDWATEISVHSINRAPVAYSNDFTTGLAGMEAFGIAAVADGALKITTAINDSYGAASISAPIQTYESLNVTWKSYVGGGGGGGADGYSLNIGSDVPANPGYGGEEGIGTGLTVTVDTFDNGTGLDVGVDIKWGGLRVAYIPLPKDDPGDGNFIRKSQFVDASLSLSPAGVASVTYDGHSTSATIPNYAGLRADRALFWARTGGANDNQWVDDFGFTGFLYDNSSSEASQTITFLVENSNPSLFSVQPAVSPTGTLTYTPAPNAFGTATVTVVAKDSGGTAAGGNDTSAPFTFIITVNPVNDCPTLDAVAPIVMDQNTTRNGQLVGADIDDAFTYIVVTTPLHGQLVLNAQSGAFAYTPVTGYTGSDGFGVATLDAAGCRSAVVNVSVTVQGTVSNRCPLAVASIQPNIVLAAGQTETVVISSDGLTACLSLDGSGSSDPDGDALTYIWVVVLSDGSTVPLASGATATACLDVGSYTVRLIVDDGRCTRTADTEVEIITVGEAIDVLIDAVNNASLGRQNKRPFIASLKAAVASFDRGSCNSGVNQLNAFINKVRAQVSRNNPAIAAEWIALANAILAQIDCPEEQ